MSGMVFVTLLCCWLLRYVLTNFCVVYGVVGVWGVGIFVLSVMHIGGGVPVWVVCVFRRVDVVSVVYPVAILSAVFCVICSLLMFVTNSRGDHMVETYSSTGFLMALHVARIVSFCFPRVVDVSALSICIVLRAFVVCEFESRVIPILG